MADGQVLPLQLTLPHLDVAADDLASNTVSTAGGAGEEEVIVSAAFLSLFPAVVVVAHAHAEARLSAVEGSASLELNRVGSGGHRTALVAQAAEEGQLAESDSDACRAVVELEPAFEDAAKTAITPLRVEVKVDPVMPLGERAAAASVSTHARVVLRVGQLDTDQAPLVPAGVPEAVF